MTTSTESLERKIENAVEQLVREHLAACEAAATAAVRKSFHRATSRASKPRQGGRRTRERATSRRRSREEIAELEEQLYATVCAHPGETMTVLAETLGSTSRELNRAALVLRRNGRVRSVGRRGATRYFPLGE
jgi:hypothetical protein